jgi:hypothetical protein
VIRKWDNQDWQLSKWSKVFEKNMVARVSKHGAGDTTVVVQAGALSSFC